MSVTKTQTEMRSINPATEEVLATYQLSTAGQIETALNLAQKAFRT